MSKLFNIDRYILVELDLKVYQNIHQQQTINTTIIY